MSRPAVAALGLGALSALALVSPVFLVVPLVAIAVAVAAILDVDREGAPKAGRPAALAALALAAGFGGQAAAANLAARSIAAARAGAAADVFLEAVRQGRLTDAEAMCGFEARPGVGRLAACGAVGTRGRPLPADQASAWVVRIAPQGPGDCDVRLVLEPTAAVQRMTRVERWLVTACDVSSAQAVRPSAR